MKQNSKIHNWILLSCQNLAIHIISTIKQYYIRNKNMMKEIKELYYVMV